MPDRNENAGLIFTSYDVYVIDLKEIFLDALKGFQVSLSKSYRVRASKVPPLRSAPADLKYPGTNRVNAGLRLVCLKLT